MNTNRQKEGGGEGMAPEGFGTFFMAVGWPWYLALGVAGYLILHALAGREIPLAGETPEETALYAHRLVWKTAAAIFQYLLPGACGLGAVLSFRRGLQRRKMDE